MNHNSSLIISPKDLIALELPSRTHCKTKSNSLRRTSVSLTSTRKPSPISAEQLLSRIKQQQQQLLIIDLRTLDSYLGPNGRLKGSINVNFPSLLIKRFRKGTPTNFKLSPFITTEAGKRYYSRLEKTYQPASVLSQLDICVIDDHLVDDENDNNCLGKILLDLLTNLLVERQRGLFYLNEKFENLLKKPNAQDILLLDDNRPPPTILSTPTTTTTTTTTTTSSSGPHPSLHLQSSTLPPSTQQEDNNKANNPPPTITALKTKPPKLRRIDTSESLLSAPRSTTSLASKNSLTQLKISHLNLNCSPLSCSLSPTTHPNQTQTANNAHESSKPHHVKFTGDDDQVASGAPRITNEIARSPCSPNTDPDMIFKVSTIIPSFLYLGPEPSKESDFAELNRLGVCRILNTAVECVEEEQLIQNHYPFITKYFQIPLRDFVEETGIQNGIQQANRILNDAFLHSAPTYVHCKAGKSRSVTIVLAYLMHRYRWSLKKSYAHVSQQRQGICPNIGFLAELMNYEQRELGSQSHSILGMSRNRMGATGGHVKNARSVSHYYGPSPTGFSVPNTSTSTSGGGPESPSRMDGGAGSAGLAGYSMDGRRPSSHAHSLDLVRHHGFRVRSLAVGAKNDFFPPASSNLPNPVLPILPSPDPHLDSFRKGPRDSLPAGFFPSSHPEPADLL